MVYLQSAVTQPTFYQVHSIQSCNIRVKPLLVIMQLFFKEQYTKLQLLFTTKHHVGKYWFGQLLAFQNHGHDIEHYITLVQFLTCSILVYKHCRTWKSGKTKDISVTYQSHSSSADCTRQLFKSSKDSTSFQVCNVKKFFTWDFCE